MIKVEGWGGVKLKVLLSAMDFIFIVYLEKKLIFFPLGPA
jgi:hypothetical protein